MRESAFELIFADRRSATDWEWFKAESSIALGLSPGARDRLIRSSHGALRPANRSEPKRGPIADHAVDANLSAKRFEQDGL